MTTDTQLGNESHSNGGPPADNVVSASGDPKSGQTRRASEPVPPKSRRATRRRRLLIGALGVLVLAAAIAFGVPSIRLALNTVSTDDAYVNGHVTFVASRVRGQVSRVLVDDNYRVHQSDLLVELDKEPF